MRVDPYFNLPSRPLDLAPLLADIRAATQRLYLVSAWLTNTDIATAFAETPACEKQAILNAADIVRPGSHEAVKVLLDRSRAERVSWESWVHVLGSGDWKEGVMHCKFIVADDILWLGSYNFTWQAQRNYEVLLRIVDEKLAHKFVLQCQRMIDDWPLWQGSTQFADAINGEAFRCATCERIVPYKELGVNGGSWMQCKRCVAKQGRA